MTGASAAVGGETPTDSWQRISTPRLDDRAVAARG